MINLRVLVLGLTISCCVKSYELETHGITTLTGYSRSDLGNGSPASAELYKNLGIDRLGNLTPANRLAPFSIFAVSGVEVAGFNVSSYYDLAATNQAPPVAIDNVFARRSLRFEQARMPPSYALAPTDPIDDFPYSDRASSIEGWIMRGAIREDDMPQSILKQLDIDDPPDDNPYFVSQLLNANSTVRVFNHFYNPLLLDNAELPVLPTLPFLGQNLSALAWAIGVEDPMAPSFNPALSRNNHFTWQDAREFYWRALTWKTRPAAIANTLAGTQFDYVARMRYFSSTFKSIGHVVHLLQDLAQPQHSRNDPHNPHIGVGKFKCCGTDINRRLYEAYTEARIGLAATGGSDPTRYLRAMFEDGVPVPNFFPAIQLGNYPIPQFSTPVKFFTTRPNRGGAGDANPLARRGLADYSNRGFFTDGTRPGMVAGLANPPPLTDAGWSFVERDQVIPSTGITVRQGNFFRVVPDSVAPNYIDSGENASRQVFHGSGSIWENVAGQQGQQIDADLLGMTQQADMLLPRAAAYSAGIINFFFRGKIEVTAPTYGLLAAIDHAVLHSLNANGFPIRTDNGTVYGFTAIKLKIRNATGAITEPGNSVPILQNMSATGLGNSDAKIVAVVRYHRNPCYKPDLTSERTINSASGIITEPTGCAGNNSREPIPETSVSRPLVLSAAQLNTLTPTEVTFDFTDDPLPINATDIFVQVVYYGQLGDEPNGVAIGAMDVMEPSYYTVWNNTDYRLSSNAWTTANTLILGMAQSRICHDSRLVFVRGGVPAPINTTTGVTRFNRVALLTDTSPHSMRSRVVLGDVNSTVEITTLASVVGKVRQANKEFVSAQSPYLPTPLNESRGLVWGSAGVYLYRFTPANSTPMPPDPGTLLPLWGPTSPTMFAYEPPKEGVVGNPIPGSTDPNGVCPLPTGLEIQTAIPMSESDVGAVAVGIARDR